MATIAERSEVAAPAAWHWTRVRNNRNFLGFWFMLPAAAFLLLFLTYPLGLGIWLSFTDTRIGRSGVFISVQVLKPADHDAFIQSDFDES